MVNSLMGCLLTGIALVPVGLAATVQEPTKIAVTLSGVGENVKVATLEASATSLTFMDKGVIVKCDESKANKIPAAVVTLVANVGTEKGNAPLRIATAKFGKPVANGCTGPLGGKVIITPKKNTEELYVDGITTATRTPVYIDDIHVEASENLGLFTCTFDVEGDAPGYYANGHHALTMTPKLPDGLNPVKNVQLTVTSVTAGCLGLVSRDSHPTLTGTFEITSAPGKPANLSIESVAVSGP
jgi:hypothetical protein